MGNACTLAALKEHHRPNGTVRGAAWHLLRVAAELPQPFTWAALVIACWRRAPECFGLKGYEQTYPSDHRVMSALAGRKGALGRGKIERVGTRGYRVAGLTEAKLEAIKKRRDELCKHGQRAGECAACGRQGR